MRADSKAVKYRIGATSFLTTALFLNMTTAHAVVVNFSVIVAEFSCQTSVSQSKIDFGTLTESGIQEQKSKTIPFTVTISDCEGKTNPQRVPGIKVRGAGIDTGTERLFRTSGTSKEYGVRLIRTTSAGENQLVMYDTMIPVGNKGTEPTISAMDFKAMVSCGVRCANAEPGSLSAAVTFDFVYE